MPREARIIPAGVVVHVICRFTNDEFLMAGPAERAEMLRRAERASRRTDWQLLHYAWMSSHSHWSFYTGDAQLSDFFHPLNTGFACWLNGRNEKHGPVFSSRPKTLIIKGDSARGLGAYIHNNPSRAKVVDHPADSTWTSHRAYLGLDPAPPWLNVELGLRLMDLPPGDAGRSAFAEYVAERSGNPRDPKWSGGNRKERRKRVRRALGAPVETATPVMVDEADRRFEQPLVAHSCPPVQPPWPGSIREVLEAVSIATGISMERLLSKRRTRSVVAARKVCLLAWTRQLGRPAVEMTCTLGISEAAGSQLLASACDDQMQLAAVVATRLRSLAA